MTYIEPQAHEQPRRAGDADDADLEGFLAKLTELSLETGIGIADSPTLYVIEREDRGYAYAADKDGRLVLR